MILKNIIPSNVLSALRTYIRNYVDSLAIPTISYGSYYEVAGTNDTTFSNANVYVNLSCDSSSVISSGFSVSRNKITNIGSSAITLVSAILAISGTDGDNIGFAIFKNGSLIPSSEQRIIISGSNIQNALPFQALVLLGTNDYVEIYVKNIGATNNITTINLNVTATQI